MSTTQPEALRLADMLDSDYDPDWFYEIGVDEVVKELRRLHAENAHADRYAEQLGRELAKATAEIAGLRAQLEVSPLMGAAGDAGWVMVPKEPTLAMGWAYLDAARESEPLRTHLFNHDGYRAMIAAAPSSTKGVAHGPE